MPPVATGLVLQMRVLFNKSEVYCIVSSICLLGLINITT